MFILNTIYRFTIIGLLGFFVDVIILYMVSVFMGFIYGRLISFFLAVCVTWYFNRSWTFKKTNSFVIKNKNIIKEFISYLILMMIGGIVNFSIYYILLFNYSFINNNPIIGVAVGSIAA